MGKYLYFAESSIYIIAFALLDFFFNFMCDLKNVYCFSSTTFQFSEEVLTCMFNRERK